jgi:hypothetical protein
MLEQAAYEVANIPTFIWFDQTAKVAHLPSYLAGAKEQGPNTILPIVIYNLPERDCAAPATQGELTLENNGQAAYLVWIAFPVSPGCLYIPQSFIDQIASAIKGITLCLKLRIETDCYGSYARCSRYRHHRTRRNCQLDYEPRCSNVRNSSANIHHLVRSMRGLLAFFVVPQLAFQYCLYAPDTEST